VNRLLNAFRADPTPSNRAKLQAYLNKHPMAVCLAMPAEQEFLRVHGFTF
jgi:hypothetical protein